VSVRVAIVDSGVNPSHPHVGGVAAGIAIGAREDSALYLDYLGHGTAVAGAIREKAPDAELLIAKVFDRSLSTSADRLLRAIDWAIAQRADLINLSLGTSNSGYRGRFEDAVARAATAGAVIVAAHQALPGSLAGVVSVDIDWSCPRDVYRVEIRGGRPCFLASGYPRPIPGHPVERNLSGVSFAVANLTGFAARVAGPRGQSIEKLLAENAPAAGESV
jgi:hypothetical protein